MAVEAGGERGQRVEEHVTRWVIHSGLFLFVLGEPTFSPKQSIRNKLTFQFSDPNFHQQIPEC